MPNPVIKDIIRAVPDPMVYIADNGEIDQANHAALSVFGDWIVGHSHDAVFRQPALLSRVEAVLGGEPDSDTRIERSEHSGLTQYRVRITAIRLDGARGLLLHFTDITHLSEAEEMRRDFVANVSHELRTPLTAVMGFIETLRGPARDDPGAQERFLGIMGQEARRMNRLVSDLLSLSRVESTERVRPNDALNLTSVLQGALAALRPGAEETGNNLILKVDESAQGTLATMQGDQDQIMQVFLNLTENALKYGGPNKPVTLTLSRGEGRGNLRGPVLQVDVTDLGDGIDSLHLPRLTERFYRVDTHRSREMGGTGLGLAIVKHIVNRHRGRLKITSEQGQGSTFSVIFPVA